MTVLQLNSWPLTLMLSFGGQDSVLFSWLTLSVLRAVLLGAVFKSFIAIPLPNSRIRSLCELVQPST